MNQVTSSPSRLIVRIARRWKALEPAYKAVTTLITVLSIAAGAAWFTITNIILRDEVVSIVADSNKALIAQVAQIQCQLRFDLSKLQYEMHRYNSELFKETVLIDDYVHLDELKKIGSANQFELRRLMVIEQKMKEMDTRLADLEKKLNDADAKVRTATRADFPDAC